MLIAHIINIVWMLDRFWTIRRLKFEIETFKTKFVVSILLSFSSNIALIRKISQKSQAFAKYHCAEKTKCATDDQENKLKLQ